MEKTILDFVKTAPGLKASLDENGRLVVHQDIDEKSFGCRAEDISEVLERFDSDNNPFLQVNFDQGLKIILTEALVGFKPVELSGLDMSKLPRVVTTPDLVSVSEAIEDALDSEITPYYELELLKKVFLSILQGGELVGFDLSQERRWLERLGALVLKGNA